MKVAGALCGLPQVRYGIVIDICAGPRVAAVLRGVSGRGWESLELKGNNEQHVQHEKGLAKKLSP